MPESSPPERSEQPVPRARSASYLRRHFFAFIFWVTYGRFGRESLLQEDQMHHEEMQAVIELDLAEVSDQLEEFEDQLKRISDRLKEKRILTLSEKRKLLREYRCAEIRKKVIASHQAALHSKLESVCVALDMLSLHRSSQPVKRSRALDAVIRGLANACTDLARAKDTVTVEMEALESITLDDSVDLEELERKITGEAPPEEKKPPQSASDQEIEASIREIEAEVSFPEPPPAAPIPEGEG